jgi:hypothetical protein
VVDAVVRETVRDWLSRRSGLLPERPNDTSSVGCEREK